MAENAMVSTIEKVQPKPRIPVRKVPPQSKGNAGMDEASLQRNYAKKLINAKHSFLSFIGDPNPDFVGREKEVAAVKEALLKRRMKNLILVGEPGVGKTEILKKALSELDTGDVFINVDLAGMLAGCTLVGMFEERWKELMDCILSANRNYIPKICLFIDEIHNLFRVGKSDAYGTFSGGEMLKPYLSDGRITVFGATTEAEYEKYVKADKALLRRLPPLFIEGMADRRTVKIVKEFAKRDIDTQTVHYIVEQSKRVTYLNNPDCSLEIADRVIAKAILAKKPVDINDVDEVISMMIEEDED